MSRRRAGQSSRGKVSITFLSGLPPGFAEHQNPARFLSGVKAHSEFLGFGFNECSWPEYKGNIVRLRTTLRANNTCAIIFHDIHNLEAFRDLPLDNFACGSVGRHTIHPQLSYASADHYQIMRLALQRLRSLGYQRIGLILSRLINTTTDGKYLAAYYLDSHEQTAQPEIPAFLTEVPSCAKSMEMPANFALWVKKNRVDVVLSACHFAREWLQQCKLRIPTDIGYAVLDIDSHDVGAGVLQPNQQVGAAAVDIVVGQMNRGERGATPWPKIVHIQSDWHDGDSAPGILARDGAEADG